MVQALEVVFCASCGSEHNDKYDAALCCDQLRPGETDEDQLRRLFSDEITHDAQVAAEIAVEAAVEAARPKPVDAARLRKVFKVGKRVVDKGYNLKWVDLIIVNVHKDGALVAQNQRETQKSRDDRTVLYCYGATAAQTLLDTGQLTVI